MVNPDELPLIIEPEELEPLLGNPGVLIVDLSDRDKHQTRHLPGALHLDVARLLRQEPPVMGLLPRASDLEALFSELGLTPETHVVAYDSEGGGRASRLLWTLDIVGHQAYSLLNGGANAWFAEGHPQETTINQPTPAHYPVTEPEPETAPAFADKRWLLDHLQRAEVGILDARTPDEYAGTDVRAARAGHIPGAANLNWTDVLDPDNRGRLKSAGELLGMLDSRGILPTQEVVTHCQTHHRSALLWVVLKSLGFEKVRGYAGSWSEWGNAQDTPIA